MGFLRPIITIMVINAVANGYTIVKSLKYQ